MPEWINHIELVVLASLIVLIVSSFVNSVVSCGVQKWILKSSECKECPTVKENQARLRDVTLPALIESISDLKIDIKGIDTKVTLLMKGLKLVSEDEEKK